MQLTKKNRVTIFLFNDYKHFSHHFPELQNFPDESDT